ncbi:hypothetical protein GF318_05025 [Candidatus Micrarchaeota archaeon]|nr:hypothetical protein [Candidatus Micrarchaeota archaeon]
MRFLQKKAERGDKKPGRVAAAVLASGLMLSCSGAPRKGNVYTFCPYNVTGPKLTARCNSGLGCRFTAREGERILKAEIFGSEYGECSKTGEERLSIYGIRDSRVLFITEREIYGRKTTRETLSVPLNNSPAEIPVMDRKAEISVKRTEDPSVVRVKVKLK